MSAKDDEAPRASPGVSGSGARLTFADGEMVADRYRLRRLCLRLRNTKAVDHLFAVGASLLVE
jgi:hypothetical protein